MNYRKFPGTDITASALGMGCMRLPVLPGEDHPIDRAEGKRMVDRAIDGGITYFDTAYGYHNEESEVFVGEALKGLHHQLALLEGGKARGSGCAAGYAIATLADRPC